MDGRSFIERLALLLQYPREDFLLLVAEAHKNMSGEPGDVTVPFTQFAEGIAGLDTEELQELYTRTFDLNPMCTLEIGWQLYGEDYRRGEFLVKMRQHLQGYGLPESGELPDHMTHALALLARLEPDEAAAFGGQYVLPALDKMLSGWQQTRNAYTDLLESVFASLTSRYAWAPLRGVAQNRELPVLQ